jgi:hypothetical protein
MAGTVRVTHAGGYVEVDPGQTAIVTHAGGYVETGPPNKVWTTHAGLYIEIGESPPVMDGMLVYNGIILDGWLDAFSMDAIAQAIDISNFASEGAQYMTGLPQWSLEIGGPWDEELDSILGIDAVRSLDDLRSAWLRLEGVRYEWIPTLTDADRGAILSNYQVISQPNDAIRWTATLTCSRSPQRFIET